MSASIVIISASRAYDEGQTARPAAPGSITREVYERLLRYPGLGPFLAFQYAIDLNYSDLLDFDEDDFVVAGPGALDGISKCFVSTGQRSAAAIFSGWSRTKNLSSIASGSLSSA